MKKMYLLVIVLFVFSTCNRKEQERIEKTSINDWSGKYTFDIVGVHMGEEFSIKGNFIIGKSLIADINGEQYLEIYEISKDTLKLKNIYNDVYEIFKVKDGNFKVRGSAIYKMSPFSEGYLLKKKILLESDSSVNEKSINEVVIIQLQEMKQAIKDGNDRKLSKFKNNEAEILFSEEPYIFDILENVELNSLKNKNTINKESEAIEYSDEGIEGKYTYEIEIYKSDKSNSVELKCFFKGNIDIGEEQFENVESYTGYIFKIVGGKLIFKIKNAAG